MLLRVLRMLCFQAPGLWKADIDAAFRRVPLQDPHKWAAAVAYIFQGEPWIAVHQSVPFGATASVLAWHKVGALILDLARQLLHLPVFRYVDDYFAAERHVVSMRPCIVLFCCASGLDSWNTAWIPSCGSCAHCSGRPRWPKQRKNLVLPLLFSASWSVSISIESVNALRNSFLWCLGAVQ